MKKAVVEFIGTFFLVLTIGLTVIEPGAGNLAPLAIGFMLMVMVYAGGPISGGHYNPAVTLAAWLRGACHANTVPVYMGAQALAAICAASIVGALKQGSYISAISLHAWPAFVAELIFTFALAFVVLNVATTKKAAGNSYFGLAIGSTVTASAFAAGHISGAAFNPAVAVGLAVMGLVRGADLWLFFVANLLGGALAAVVFRFVHGKS